MFVYEKRLQYPVKIKNPNPSLAKFIITQYGGPDGFRDNYLYSISKTPSDLLNTTWLIKK